MTVFTEKDIEFEVKCSNEVKVEQRFKLKKI